MAPSTIPMFIRKLKALVDDDDVDGAYWSRDGSHVIMPEPHSLSTQLAKYFKSSTKLKSFVRQLHFYGFRKTGGSRTMDWIYTHKYFTRDGGSMHKVRRKAHGADRQVRKLKKKVDTLNVSLADTQCKLKKAATALVVMLQETCQAFCNGSLCASFKRQAKSMSRKAHNQ